MLNVLKLFREYVNNLKRVTLSNTISLCNQGVTFIMSQRALGQGSPFPHLENGILRLYSMRFCPYAQRTRLVLIHKGVLYQEVNINLKRKPDWFLERNPLGLVPVLEKNGHIVYESAVCDEYLDDIYPQRPLIPTDPYKKAQEKIMMETFSRIPTLLYKVLKSDNKTEEVNKLFDSLQPYENFLKEDYFGGAEPSMLDFHIWPWFERMEVMRDMTGIDPWPKSRYPRINEWFKRMKTLPAVEKTYMEPESHARFFTSLAAGNPDYDHGLNEAKL